MKIADYTEGVLATATNLLLVSIHFGFQFAKEGYNKGWGAEAKKHATFKQLNYKSIKRAARYLKQVGLVKTARDNSTLPGLTEKGNKKMDKIIPKYNKKRTWDGKLYLITYDIPERLNKERNLLRRYLRTLKCTMLQQSVWITPYNPIKAVRDFADNHSLKGLIIISSLGKDGTIGEVKVPDLMERIYNLDELNRKYKEFIVKAGIGKEAKIKLVFSYFSILKEDPQLPFDLLPEGWLGENANQVFRRITR